MEARIVLVLILGTIAIIAIGIYAGNQALIQADAEKAEIISELKDYIKNECNSKTGAEQTDISSIQRAFQRCFNDFNINTSAKTCINYMRFKDCINREMGRFK